MVKSKLHFYWQSKINDCNNGMELYDIVVKFYKENSYNVEFERYVTESDNYHNASPFEKGMIKGVFGFIMGKI